MSSKLRIVVAGMAGIFPVGGMAWHYLQYVIGLAQLGHDVFYYEDTYAWPYHPVEKRNTPYGDYTARYFESFSERYAPVLGHRWCYLHLHDTAYGMSRQSIDEVLRTADLFINVSGGCRIPSKLSSKCVTIFLDTDPGYNQITLSKGFENPEQSEPWYAQVSDYDQHFTFGENIASNDSAIPTVGLDWKTTRMPIVLDLWSPLAKPSRDESAAWTTVMTWNAFRGKLVYHGVEYHSKGVQLERFLDLPQRVPSRLTIAIGGENAPVQRLKSHGWNVVDGPAATRSPQDYQNFIAASRGEFSIAKHIYVAMRTGWFSDRSACYLAAGRPVVVQDTGFSRRLPVGWGIVPFNTFEEARAALHEVESDYARHARAAREIAGAFFDAHKVLSRLIEDSLGYNSSID